MAGSDDDGCGGDRDMSEDSGKVDQPGDNLPSPDLGTTEANDEAALPPGNAGSPPVADRAEAAKKWGQAFLYCWPIAHCLVRRRGVKGLDAESVAQDVAVHVSNRTARTYPNGAPEGWIESRIALAVRDRVRGYRTKEGRYKNDSVASENLTTPENCDRLELDELINKIQAVLTQNEWVVVNLKILGLGAGEIVSALDIQPATLRKRLERARQRLNDAGIPSDSIDLED